MTTNNIIGSDNTKLGNFEQVGFGNPVLVNAVAMLNADVNEFENYCSIKDDGIRRLIFLYEDSSRHGENADRKRIISELVKEILGTDIGLTPREESFKRQILRTIVWLERSASHDQKLKTQCDDLLTRVNKAAAFLRVQRESAKKALAPPMGFADWWLGYSKATLDRLVCEATNSLRVHNEAP